MQLFVQIPGRGPVGIEIDRNKTVGDLKASVAAQTGISVANLRFICAGRAQEDNYVKINELDLAKGTMVTMVPNGVRQLEVELPVINYEFPPLPADISSRRDCHKFRVFCRGVDGFTHDVRIFKPYIIAYFSNHKHCH
jgi:hypothetical protein